MPTLATFNANNFFLRYKFSNTYPGDRSRTSLVEAAAVASVGYIPERSFGRYASTRYIVWDATRRELANHALREPDGQLPDILCLQEVENIHAIRIFNERYLGNHYPHSLLIDAYDPRNIDVGLLSRFPITRIRSHIDDVDDDGNQPFRSRDCLEVDISIPGNQTLTLFLGHLKSKFVQHRAGASAAEKRRDIQKSHGKRLAQAKRVMQYIDDRFRGQHNTALYAVVGDLNDTPESPWVKPLMRSSRLANVIREHRGPDDHWTYYWRSRNRVSQIDYILASQALRRRINRQVNIDQNRRPHIERAGLAFKGWSVDGETLPRQATFVHFEKDAATPAPAGATPSEKVPFRFPRYAAITDNWRSNISDHCPVKVWF